MTATDGLPIHNLLDRDSPGATLDLMRALTEAALTARVDLLHPSDVVLTLGGRPGLSVVDRREPCVTWSPEAARSGPTPATLSFSVAALGALAALGSVDQSPETPEEHRVWLEHLLARLEVRWAGNPGAARALEQIGRCLAHDPFSRPRPRQLLEQLGPAEAARTLVPTSTGLSSPSAGLSSLTGGSRSRATSSLTGLTASPVPASSQFAWVAAAMAVLALAMATCTLGTVLGKLAVSPSSLPSPQVVVQPVPIPFVAEPVAPTPAAVQVAVPDPEPSPVVVPAAAPPRPAPPRPSPRPESPPRNLAGSGEPPAPAPAPAPVPAPGPAPTSGASNDLRDPWKN
jgi:hypothetical protein